jgi:hypothetical protein
MPAVEVRQPACGWPATNAGSFVTTPDDRVIDSFLIDYVSASFQMPLVSISIRMSAPASHPAPIWTSCSPKRRDERHDQRDY